jgi:hypothetical protein
MNLVRCTRRAASLEVEVGVISSGSAARTCHRGNCGSQFRKQKARVGEPARALRDFYVIELPAISTTIATTTAASAATAATTAATVVATTATTTVVATAATTTVAATAAAVSSAATTATAAAVSTATAAVSTAATAAAALLALLGFVDSERPTVEGAAIHTLDGLRGFFRGTHGHEREAARTAGLAIGNQVDITDGSELLERGADALSIGVE